MDSETAGLSPGSEVYVISLYNTKTKATTNFISDGSTDKHIIDAAACMDHSSLPICTFNGTSFDFKMLAAATSDKQTKSVLAKLALFHVDIMLQFACSNGYFTSLASLSVPTLNRGKIGSGGSVQKDWEAGKKNEIVDYCADDAQITAKLYEYGATFGRLSRLSKARKQSIWVLPTHKHKQWQFAIKALEKITVPDFLESPPDIASLADWTLNLI